MGLQEELTDAMIDGYRRAGEEDKLTGGVASSKRFVGLADLRRRNGC